MIGNCIMKAGKFISSTRVKCHTKLNAAISLEKEKKMRNMEFIISYLGLRRQLRQFRAILAAIYLFI